MYRTLTLQLRICRGVIAEARPLARPCPMRRAHSCARQSNGRGARTVSCTERKRTTGSAEPIGERYTQPQTISALRWRVLSCWKWVRRSLCHPDAYTTQFFNNRSVQQQSQVSRHSGGCRRRCTPICYSRTATCRFVSFRVVTSPFDFLRRFYDIL